ncbi:MULTISPECIES: glycosyltransferase [Galbibacter]|uniref:Glycosyltransferase n=1 Tax=Galbibacter pacificus TaxID=2996052 RepID=A0ABT6FQH3_9FLAO|nr:glycosyltransferase [Galbibacter pacificus]MDG3582012.1 glycosyltransferase [Galbibacter pacificus]MDG3585514.1 glycosyltransferase [Galbibacter pacificus]
MGLVNKKVLFIGYVWPEPTSSAAGSRILQLIRFFMDANCQITFASPAKHGEHMHDLTSEGVQQKKIELNSASFDEFIIELQPDVVVFDRYMMEEQFGWRIAEHCPNALRILDTEDLHFLRDARRLALKDENNAGDLKLLENNLAKREIASIYRCDISLIISEAEHALLTGLFKIDKKLLCHLPFLLDENLNELQKKWLAWEEKQDFIFIGNFIHAPNWDAVLALKETVWPHIKRKLPDAKLHIFGAYAGDKVHNLNNKKDGFLVHGWAKNAKKEFQKAKVCLAPLRFGAGLKGKLVEAMLYGTPSVTTTIGAEGINGNFPWNGAVFDNPEAFVQAAVDLYQNKNNSWEEARKNGATILKHRFDGQKHKELLKTSITGILQNLTGHRTQNFTGAMLMQQTVQASKYMSKWIMEKNKKNQ